MRTRSCEGMLEFLLETSSPGRPWMSKLYILQRKLIIYFVLIVVFILLDRGTAQSGADLLYRP
jgi:hypothetical protein